MNLIHPSSRGPPVSHTETDQLNSISWGAFGKGQPYTPLTVELICFNMGHGWSSTGWMDQIHRKTKLVASSGTSADAVQASLIEPEAPAWQAEILPLNQ